MRFDINKIITESNTETRSGIIIASDKYPNPTNMTVREHFGKSLKKVQGDISHGATKISEKIKELPSDIKHSLEDIKRKSEEMGTIGSGHVNKFLKQAKEGISDEASYIGHKLADQLGNIDYEKTAGLAALAAGLGALHLRKKLKDAKKKKEE